jgi:peptidyl-prolyl cis-trans isomerase A (cyclophilin A)
MILLCFGVASGQTKPVRIQIETELGNIEAEIDAARAPVMAANFLKYVQGGFYNGGRFHRTVKLNPDNQPGNAVKIEVIQAGINLDRRADGFPPIPRTPPNGFGIY